MASSIWSRRGLSDSDMRNLSPWAAGAVSRLMTEFGWALTIPCPAANPGARG